MVFGASAAEFLVGQSVKAIPILRDTDDTGETEDGACAGRRVDLSGGSGLDKLL